MSYPAWGLVNMDECMFNFRVINIWTSLFFFFFFFFFLRGINILRMKCCIVLFEKQGVNWLRTWSINTNWKLKMRINLKKIKNNIDKVFEYYHVINALLFAELGWLWIFTENFYDCSWEMVEWFPFYTFGFKSNLPNDYSLIWPIQLELHLCRRVKLLPTEYPGSDTKQFDCEAPVMLELWECRGPLHCQVRSGPEW